MGNNLPPGVTPSDIDKHFGEPDYKEKSVAARAVIDVVARGIDDEAIKNDAREQIREAVNESINGVQMVHIEIDNIE